MILDKLLEKKDLLAYIAYRTANCKFAVYVPNREIAKDCGFHYNTVNNTIKKLALSDLIDRKYITSRNDRRII